jgi:cyclase
MATKSTNMFYGAKPILFEFAKKMRENPTKAEAVLWQYLSNNQRKGFRFKRQHPIKYFIADFYCHSKQLVIEVDGGYHQIPEQYEYDKNRDDELEALGVKVLRFTNEQIFFEMDHTIKTIDHELYDEKE